MPNIGPLELAIVLIIALVVFGPKRLPELGRSLGKGIREFRGSVGGDSHDEPEQPRELDRGRRQPRRQAGRRRARRSPTTATEASPMARDEAGLTRRSAHASSSTSTSCARA